MDAMQFLKTVGQICKTNNEKCDECPLDKCPCSAYINCMVDTEQDKDIEEMVKIADRWAKDHPVKTRKSEFQKMFPNANMYSITTTFCTAHFDKKKACEVRVPSVEMCEKCRYKYWNEEVDE